MANFRSQLTCVDSGSNPDALEKELVDAFRTNVVGNVNLINLALPLLEKGTGKKIVVLTSGVGDLSLAADYNIFESPSYAISKTAADMMVAKYHAEHNSSGLLFVAISPGLVDTGNMVQRKSAVLIMWAILTAHSFGCRKCEEIGSLYCQIQKLCSEHGRANHCGRVR